MDKIEESIIKSLTIDGKMKFEELFNSTKNKFYCSRQTFDFRLKGLLNKGIILKTKPYYLINVDNKTKQAYATLSKTLAQIERVIEKLPENPDLLHQSFHHIMEALNMHNRFTFMLLSGNYTKSGYARKEIEDTINRLSKIIREVLLIVSKKDKEKAHLLTHVIEYAIDQQSMVISKPTKNKKMH